MARRSRAQVHQRAVVVGLEGMELGVLVPHYPIELGPSASNIHIAQGADGLQGLLLWLLLLIGCVM